jgi:hypothetical protein
MSGDTELWSEDLRGKVTKIFRERDLQVQISVVEVIQEQLIQAQEHGDILAVVDWLEGLKDALKAKLKDNG